MQVICMQFTCPHDLQWICVSPLSNNIPAWGPRDQIQGLSMIDALAKDHPLGGSRWLQAAVGDYWWQGLMQCRSGIIQNCNSRQHEMPTGKQPSDQFAQTGHGGSESQSKISLTFGHCAAKWAIWHPYSGDWKLNILHECELSFNRSFCYEKCYLKQVRTSQTMTKLKATMSVLSVH